MDKMKIERGPTKTHHDPDATIEETNNKEDLFNLKPELKEMLEKLTDPNLPQDEFVKVIHDFNSKIEEPVGRKIVRNVYNVKNGRTIEVCIDDKGRVGLNYKL